MPLGALTHRLQAPFAACLFVFAEHTLAGTRGVHKDAVKQMLAALAVFGGGVMRDNGVAVAPFLNVLAEDKYALTHHLVAQQQAVLTEELTDECTLTTRRRTEVQHHRRRIDILLQRLLDEHRRGLLYIVTTGMEKRIQRELRTLAQIIPVDMPRHLVRVALEGQHIQFGIQTNRGNRLRFQRP